MGSVFEYGRYRAEVHGEIRAAAFSHARRIDMLVRGPANIGLGL